MRFDQLNRRIFGRVLRAATLTVALASVMLSTTGAAQKERYCSVPSVGPPDCSYTMIEACRAAHGPAGRCSPEEWLMEKRPARRVNVNAPPSSNPSGPQARPRDDDTRPKPRIDPNWTPSWIEGIGMSARPGGVNNW